MTPTTHDRIRTVAVPRLLSRTAAGEAGVLVWLVIAAAIGVAAGVLAVVAGQAAPSTGVAVCLAPATPVLVLRPVWSATLAIAALPFELDLVGGSLNIAPSDVLLALCVAGVALGQVRRRPQRPGERPKDARRPSPGFAIGATGAAALRPLALPIGGYFAVLALAAAVNPSRDGLIACVQRVELLVVPLIIGACVLDRAAALRALRLYLVSSLGLSLLWIAGNGSPEVLAGQKNPAGQFIAGAALLSLVIVRSAWRYPLFAVFVLGVYATQSRGALAGLVIGVLVLLALDTRHPVRFAGRVAAVAVLLIGGYLLLPTSAQQRVRGETTATQNNDQVRSLYATDAHRIIDAHPLIGVGPGNYRAGRVEDLSYTDDPHNVLLLQTGEGGYPLVIAFLLVQFGALVVALRRLRASSWSPVAAAVLTATFVHALVDVYWVRGTPVLTWLLLGLVLAGSRASVRWPSRAAAPVPFERRSPAPVAGS